MASADIKRIVLAITVDRPIRGKIVVYATKGELV